MSAALRVPRRLLLARACVSFLVLGLGVVVALPAAARTKKRTKAPTIAVLYFDYSGIDPELGALRKGLASMLINDLAQFEGVRVVERSRLQEILTELKLNRSRRIDRRSAVKIGKIVGAQYIVLGHYIYLRKKLVIEARLLDTATTVYTKVGARAQGTAETFLQVQAAVSAALRKQLRRLLPTLAKTGWKRRKSARKAKRFRRPKKLTLRTAVKYGQALDAKDRGKTKLARVNLRRVLKKAPGFGLAQRDLDRLIQ